MTVTALEPYRVVAFNSAHDSENKIHDNDTARRFGFAGGLVPGVDVYGYLTHLPAMRWGRAWLERGTAECRFYKPVYDGDVAIVSASESGDALEITLESRGEMCASGHAMLPDKVPDAPPLAGFVQVPQRAVRPPADETSLSVGTWLGLTPYPVTAEMAARYLADSQESAALYAEQSIVHPRDILRCCNFVLSRNVVFGPWIHTGSHVRHLAAVAVGSTLTARAQVTGNYEKKGHRFVEIDTLVLAGDSVPVARVAHTAIYQPRQLVAA